MTTVDSIRTEFLRDICETPEDDALRLIFADWLEDRGGEEARAEFIRVQCERAKYPECEFIAKWQEKACRKTFRPTSISCRSCQLRQREEELYRHIEWNQQPYSRMRQWAGELLENDGHVLHWDDSRQGKCSLWTRGFISRISLTLDDFMQHAAALFAEHPITEVTLTDREPYGRQWFDVSRRHLGYAGDFHPSSNLPASLFSLLAESSHDWMVAKRYDTPELALAAISPACVTYGRKLVGLPPLKGGDK